MSKTQFKTLMISFSLAVAAVCLSFAIVACGSNDDGSKSVYGVGEEGVYYYDKDSSTEYLMSLQSGTYMISADGSSGYSGTYSYDGEGEISFESSDGEPFVAAFSDDAMQLAISGTPYTFLKRVDYIVKFMDGGATVDSQTVTYGKSASETDGEKDGYIFLGWYEDSAFTTKYGFNTAVTGDLTLYAFYIEIDSTIANFDVNFVMDGETIYSTKTQNGIVYDIPEVSGILGWWVSATNDGSELTYKYDGQILDEATNLYAVKADALGTSVYGDKVTWEGSASSVTITVDGKVETSSAANGAYAYDFDSLSTGSHEIEVSASGYSTENLVYVVNGLARVSNFSVYGTTLVYNAVENAQYYYISVTCANPSHDHTMVYNGNTLTYDFSNCEMGPDGISFTVYAYGTGYTESVSETFVYALILDGTTVTIDKATDTASWTAVSGASGYEVYINGKYAVTTTDTEYSLKYYDMGDEIAVSVKPVAPGYYSEESVVAKYTKATLKAPEITGINEYTVSWTKIPGATNYIIYVNGKQIETVSGDITSYALATDEDFVRADSYVITIKATNSSDTNQNSQESDAVYASDDTLEDLLRYEDGVVYWQYAMAAGTYYVTVNDEGEEAVEGKNFFDVTFTRSGDNVITVWFTTDAGDRAEAKLTVTTYAVIFNSQGGELIDTIYVAKGDILSLATPEYVSGTGVFLGWYTLPNPSGLVLETYGGDGTEVVSGTMFTGNSTLILYACWEVTRQNITLDGGTYADMDGETEAEYDMPVSITEGVVLPVPATTDAEYAFYGWYSKEDGRGTRYTDEKGQLLVEYDNTDVTTLYACWIKVLDFTLTTSTVDGSQVYTVSQGVEIYLISEVTVPETYNGIEVGTVASGAFQNCAYLETVYIPDTIEYIATSNNGYSAGSGAFAGCSALKAIIIYETGDAGEIRYYSDDEGVLYRKNDTSGYVELLYYPYAKTGVYTIPETVSNSTETGSIAGSTDDVRIYRSVTSIATQAFYNNTKLTGITIPATIENVSSQAFYGCANLAYVTFSEDMTDVNAVKASEIVIGTEAFRNCTSLATITLPARLTEDGFSAKAFMGCSALTTINVASSNTELGSVNGMLYGKNDSKLIYCPLGKSGAVTIDGSITKIGESAFEGCVLITSVTIGASVTEIGESAFSGCTGIESVTFQGGDDSNNLEIRTKAFYGLTSEKFMEVVLPSNLVTIEAYAFGGCTHLTSVKLQSRAKTDGSENQVTYADAAFGSTASKTVYTVTELYIDKNVPEFDIAGVFGSSLEKVTIEEGNASYSSDTYGVVYDANKTQIIYCPAGISGEYSVPETVTEIKANIFAGRTGITALTVSASLTSIADYAFEGCTGIVSVTFAEGRTADLMIGAYAFSGCTSLTSIELPEHTTEIGERAFYGCSSLATFSVPSTVTSMGDYDSDGNLVSMLVFEGCTSLASITVATGNTVFASVDGMLYLKDSTGAASELVLCPANVEKTDVVFSSSLTRVWGRAFYGNNTVETISFENDSLTTTFQDGEDLFGEDVFLGTKKLTKVTLPTGLTRVSDGLFRGCGSLEEAVIPYTVTSVGKAAFYGCSSLTTVTFADMPSGTTEAELRFEDCDEENTGTGHVSNTYIYYGTFTACTSLTSVVLPDRTAYIGQYVFSGSYVSLPSDIGLARSTYIDSESALESVTIGSGVTEIAAYAFRYADKLTTVTFAETSALTSIGAEAFAYTTSLTGIEIPQSVTTLGEGTFEYSGIKTVTLPSVVQYIPERCFANCDSLTAVEIPASVLGIGYSDGISSYALSDKGGVGDDSGTIDKDLGGSTLIPGVGGSSDSDDGDDGADMDVEVSTDGAFYKCTSLASVTFAAGSQLKKIGDSSFYGCKALASIEIPAGVTDIGATAFANCTSLSEATFVETNNALELIGGNAFASTAITSFAFPETTASSLTLGSGIFKSCKKLTTVKLSAAVTSIGSALDGCYSITKIEFYYDSETGEQTNTSYANDGEQPILYSTDKGSIALVYGEIKGTLVIPTSVTAIGDSQFARQTSLTGVWIPASVTSIGSNAFLSCTSLEHVYFYTDVSDVEGLAAKGNTTVTTSLVIGRYAFGYCTSLVEINLSTSDVTSVDGETTLKSVTVGQVYDFAFAHCYSLEKVWLPATSATTEGSSGYMGTYAFAYCTALSSVEFGEGTTFLSGHMFAYDTFLTSVTIPATVTNTDTYVFAGSGLKTADLSAYTNTLKSYLFDDCADLEYVVIGSGVTSSGDYVFRGCTSLTTVVIPETLTLLGEGMFQGDTSLFVVASSESALSTAEEGSADLSAMTAISAYAFYGCSSIKSVTFASGAAIGESAFEGCSSLSTIDLSGVTAIGASAFKDCAALTSIDVTSLASIAESAFENCMGLTTLTLNANATAIGKAAFKGTSLESVSYTGASGDAAFEIPSTVTSIGDEAFCGTRIESVLIPNVLTLGNGIFKDCSYLSSVTFASNATNIGANMFYGCTSLKSVEIPASITSIPAYAFCGCTGLESVTVPATVTAIGEGAFKDCAAVKAIELSGVTEIGSYAFYGCTSLESVTTSKVKTLAAAKTSSTLSTYAFAYCTSLVSIDLSGISDTSIPQSCFTGCTRLRSVVMPSTVTTIGGYAFYGCTSLVSVSLPDAVTMLSAESFAYCTSLEEIALPSSLQTLAEGAFYGCTSLKTITIPSKVNSMNSYVFVGCTSLVEINVDSSNTTYMSVDGILCNASGEILAYPYALVSDGEVVIPEGLTIGQYAFMQNENITSVTITCGGKIGNRAFYNCMNLETVTILGEVTEIGTETFSGCVSLKSINLPESLTNIGNYAFFGCTALEDIELPNAIYEVGQYAFAYCENLKAVKFGTDTYSIDSYAFYMCTSLESVEFDENAVMMINSNAFQGCTSLVKLEVIGESIVVMGSYAFADCTALKEVALACYNVGSYMFSGCTSLSVMTIAAIVDTIDSYAFAGCTSLVEIDLPATVTSIGSGVFSGCTALETVTGGENVAKIGDYAFENTESLEGLAFMENVTSIGAYAFVGCGLETVVLSDSINSVGEGAFEGWTEAQTICVECSYYAAFQIWSVMGEEETEAFYRTAWLDGCGAKVEYGYEA